MRIIITIVLFLSFCCHGDLFAQSWQWGKGSTGSNLDAWAVATDAWGNVFAAGINFGNLPSKFGTVVIPVTGLSSYQSVLAKYDPNGNLLWARGTQNGNSYLINIAADHSGNVYLFGTYTSATIQIGSNILTNPLAPLAQYFLAKYDAGGNVAWALNDGYGQSNYVTLVNAEILGTGGIAVDNSNYVYITANFDRAFLPVGPNILHNADLSGTTKDILVAKYDPAGGLVWAKNIGGNGNDEAYGITVTPAGDIYLAGLYGSTTMNVGSSVLTNSSGGQEAFIARLDASGNPVWASGCGGTGHSYAAGIAADNSNNVYLTGGFTDTSISFNGTTITNPGHVSVLYLAKFDPANHVDWYKTINDINDTGQGTWGYSIAISQCDLVWVSGAMYGPLNIDGNILMPPGRIVDPIYIAGYTTAGVYYGSTAIQSGGDDQNGIACDGSGNVYMCSDYMIDSFAIGNDTLPKPVGESLFLGKYASVNPALKTTYITKTELCLSNNLKLDAHAGFSNYIWNTGKKGSSLTVSDTGVYWVQGFDSCTSMSVDTFKVAASCDCLPSVFVPNSFTPNGDGVNDVFYPRCGPFTKRVKTFRIYNRWGELMFSRENIDANDVANAWDGTYQGNLQLPDVFVWVVDILCENGTLVNKKGSVTIIK